MKQTADMSKALLVCKGPGALKLRGIDFNYFDFIAWSNIHNLRDSNVLNLPYKVDCLYLRNIEFLIKMNDPTYYDWLKKKVSVGKVKFVRDDNKDREYQNYEGPVLQDYPSTNPRIFTKEPTDDSPTRCFSTGLCAFFDLVRSHDFSEIHVAGFDNSVKGQVAYYYPLKNAMGSPHAVRKNQTRFGSMGRIDRDYHNPELSMKIMYELMEKNIDINFFLYTINEQFYETENVFLI